MKKVPHFFRSLCYFLDVVSHEPNTPAWGEPQHHKLWFQAKTHLEIRSTQACFNVGLGGALSVSILWLVEWRCLCRIMGNVVFHQEFHCWLKSPQMTQTHETEFTHEKEDTQYHSLWLLNILLGYNLKSLKY